MNREDIIRTANKIANQCTRRTPSTWTHEFAVSYIMSMVDLAIEEEREACEALHDHEDVQAPIGNSSWGEAYQEGWAQGTAAYRDAIRARGQE